MHFQNQGPSLPVPISPPNQQAMVGGLPYNPPFLVPVNVAPQLQQAVNLITGYSMLEVQQNAGKNEIRSFYFNLVSRNNWNNPEFLDLVNGVAAYTELLINSNRMQIEQAVHTAAAELTSMLTCATVVDYQQHLGRFVQGNMANDLNQQMQKLDHLRAQLQQAAQYRQGNFNNPSFGGGHNVGYNSPYGGNMPNRAGFNPSYGASMGPARPGFPPTSNMSNLANRNVGGGMWMGNTNTFVPNEPQVNILKPRVQNELTEVRMDSGKSEPEFKTSRFSDLPVSTERVEVMDNPEYVPLAPGKEWPKVRDLSRPWDSVLLEDGTEMRPAAFSGWTKTFDIAKPYRTLYDISKFVMFYCRRPDGSVHEVLQEKDSTMDYLKNELNPEMKQLARDADQKLKVAPNWALVEKLRPLKNLPISVNETEVDKVPNEDLLGNRDPHKVEKVIVANNIREAELKLSMVSMDSKLNGNENLIEYYADLVIPVIETDKDIQKVGLNSAVRNLSDSPSFEVLDTKLHLAISKGSIGSDALKAIDVRLTKTINEVLAKHLSLTGWEIDSYKEDFKDLLTALDDKFGNTISEKLKENASEIIAASLSVLDAEPYKQYLVSLGMSAEEAELEPMVVFASRVSITKVSWGFSDVNLDLPNGGLVSKARMPELHMALDAIFDRTLDLPVVFAHRYIQTSDRKFIEIIRGYIGEDSYLLFA